MKQIPEILIHDLKQRQEQMEAKGISFERMPGEPEAVNLWRMSQSYFRSRQAMSFNRSRFELSLLLYEFPWSSSK